MEGRFPIRFDPIRSSTPVDVGYWYEPVVRMIAKHSRAMASGRGCVYAWARWRCRVWFLDVSLVLVLCARGVLAGLATTLSGAALL